MSYSNDLFDELQKLDATIKSNSAKRKKAKTTDEIFFDDLISDIKNFRQKSNHDIAPIVTMTSEDEEDFAPLRPSIDPSKNIAGSAWKTPIPANQNKGGSGFAYNANKTAQAILGTGYTSTDLDSLLSKTKAKRDSTEDTGEQTEYSNLYNQLITAKNSNILASTQMPGTGHSVLDEIYQIAQMDSGKEKKARKASVIAQMEKLGVPAADYALFAGDSNFTWDKFGEFMGNAAMSGLGSFNKGLSSTADLILGKRLQAFGWENNPISSMADYYDDLYTKYQSNMNLNAAQLGGEGWNYAGQFTEGTVAALPSTIAALLTAGASTGATTASLTTKATYETGNLLTKAGLTIEGMLKNPQYWMSFARTYGTDYEEAKEKGASDTVAVLGATVTSLLNAAVEIGVYGGSGIQGLPKDIMSGGKSAVMDWAISSLEEGGEEIVQGVITNAVSKALYDHSIEVLDPKQMLLEGTMGTLTGAALGGGQITLQSGANAYNQYQANKLVGDEQTVFDRLVEKRIASKEQDGTKLTSRDKAKIKQSIRSQLDNGTISVEEIESVLGGESYTAFKGELDKFFGSDDYKAWKKAQADEESLPELQKEYDELHKMKRGDMTGEQIDREASLKSQIEAIQSVKSSDLQTKLTPEATRIAQMRDKMRGEVYGRVKKTRLAESYREFARSKQKFTPDMAKYTDENAKKTVQNIIDSGLGNNSNAFNRTVDFLAKLSAEKGVAFTLTNNAKLRGTEHYKPGFTTHGFVSENGDITLNVDSNRATEVTVGHEITHVLEQAGVYSKLSQAVRDYCISKEGLDKYNARIKEAEAIYNGKKNTTAEKEVTADLIGQYVFNDADFVNNLAVTDRGMFQRIYDEIKYMFKIATAGYKEARELEKVKHLFDKAYRENVKGKADTTDGGVMHSYSRPDFNEEEWSIVNRRKYNEFDNPKYDLDKDRKWMYANEKGYTVFAIYSKNDADDPTVLYGSSGKNAQRDYATLTDFFDGRRKNGKQNKSTLDRLLRDIESEYGSRGDGVHTAEIGQSTIADVSLPIGEFGSNGRGNSGNGAQDSQQLTEYNEEASESSDASFITFSNDYAAIRNFMKEGDTGESETKYSMSAEDKTKMDADYLDAVAKNDEETLRHLVREYAKASMPDSKLVTEDGNLREVYHGTNTGDFTVFNPDYIGMSSGDSGFFGMGFYFAYSKGEASYYGASRVIPAYLDIKNPFNFDRELQTYKGMKAQSGKAPDAVALMNFADKFPDIAMSITLDVSKEYGSVESISVFEFAKAFKDVIENKKFEYQEVENEYGEKETLVTADPQIHSYEYNGETHTYRDFGFQKRWFGEPKELDVAYEYLSNSVYSYIDMPRRTNVILDNNEAFTAALKEMGYDGVIQSEYGDEAVAFEPSQIKSAQLITRDDNGEVIPLSKRFDRGQDDIRYSMSKDNKGNDLSQEMLDRLQHSQVRDENGRIKAMYHGTPNGSIAEFKPGTYFTDNKEYADRYQNPGASSISSGKVASNPKTFQVYLDIRKPFDLSDPEAKRIYIEEYIKGGNAIGINPYLSDAEYAKITTIDWTEGEDLRDFLIENDYDYDGLVLDEGADGGYGEEVKYRGKSYVIFDSSQVIRADSETKYSMSKADDQYMEAVNNNDVDTLEKLVDESAKAAGYDIKAYHGTGYDFTVFDKSKQGDNYQNWGRLGKGFYFAPDSRSAQDWAELSRGNLNKVMPVYLRSANMLDSFEALPDNLKDTIPADWDSLTRRLAEKYAYNYIEYMQEFGYDVQKILVEKGYDGINGHVEYVVFDPEQVKSADPVTYAEDGSVIPLSERFNRENDDIRYSLSKAEETYNYDIENGDMVGAEKALEDFANLAMADSQIRDAEGRLIPVYHGTEAMFYEFDPSIGGGKNGTAEGFGIYLSDNQEVTKAYGDRQIKMFANITKPATSFDKTISRSTLVKLIKDTCQKEAQRMVDEDGYDSVRESIRDTWISNYVDTYSTNVEQAYREVAQSILEQNDNDKDIIHEVMFGMAIRDYESAMKFYHESLTPVTGIDGFITQWDNPNTGETSTIYLAFDSSQLKSADVITKDDNGNVIPLSDRFDSTKKDIRYGISKDGEVKKQDGLTYWDDILPHDPLDDFAPVHKDAPKVKTGKAKQNVPNVQVVDERELFPDDLAPLPVELDALIAQKETLEARMRESIEAEDLDTFTQINEEYDYVMSRIDAINADENDRLSTLDDADAPPVRGNYADRLDDSVRLSAKTTAEIAKEVKTSLGVPNKQMYEVHKLIEAYSNGEISSREQLFWALKEKFGTQEEKILEERVKEVKSFLHSYRISVSDSIKSEIADYGDLQRRNRGRIIFSRQGLPVDVAYQDMASSFPEFFPADIINPTDQLLQILDVANSEAYTTRTYEIDDETILGVAQDIIDYVGDVKYVQDQRFANQSSKDAFDALMESADDIAPVVSQPAQKAKAKAAETGTVQEKVNAKIENTKTELTKNQQYKAQSWNEYTEEIKRLQYEYDSKKNKNSIAANNLLRRIERAKRMRDNVAADYAKRISDIEKRLEKLQSPEYKRSEQRRSKYDEYRELWENMLGNTATWVDKKLGLSYKATTMRRFLRDVVRDQYGNKDFATADAIYDELETKYDHNEALLKRESGKLKESFFDLKLNKHEDAYAHMLGELRHNPESKLTEDMVKDYYNKHKNRIDTAKVNHAIDEARKTFDSLIVRVNEVLREQGMKEIPYRRGYFPHFQNPKQGFLGKLLNWKKVDTEIPTSIAGLTENFNPERSWQSFNKQRKGDTTDYSLLQGLDTYIHGALDWIYHIEDIQKRRALENYIRYIHSDEGIKERIDAIRANDTYDADEAQKQIELVLDEAANPLNNLVTELRARTNTLANKKSSMDRGMEEATNRKIYSVMTNLNNRVNANMVVGSFSSALTNFIPMVQSWHQVSPLYTVRGLGDFVRSAVRDDGMVAKSDFLTNRLIEEEKLYKTGWDKVSDKAALMMGVIDNITSQTVWRSKYLQNKHEGMSEIQAIKDADQFAKNLIAGRSRGNMPSIFDSKNPMIKICTAFQLEVANQYGFMFKDTPQDSKNAVRLVKGYAAAFMGAYLYNALYSSITGRDAAFDPFSIIEDLLRDLGFGEDDEKEETKDVILNLVDNIVDEMPFVGGFTGGGRIPLSSAMPYSGDSTPLKSFLTDVEEFGEGGFEDVMKEMLNPLYYLVMPVGGGQIKKSVEGLSMFSDDHPVAGSYTDSGALRFPVEDTFGNKVKAALFGQWANENARDYIENGRKPLGEKQIQEYIDLDLPIRDYWEYREGLKDQETLEDKFDYIAGLDVSVEQKNIMINNIVDRKDKVDMSNYDEIGDYDEFDFYTKNKEKYEFLQENNISYEAYTASEEAKETYDSIYSWVKNYPDKVTVAKAVTDDVIEYKNYTSTLDNIRADKDKNGKSISGSAKAKKKDYIFHLDLEDGQKYILFKSEYPSDDTYNYEIIDYLNSRADISYDEMNTILKELGFTIGADGKTITWD